MSKCPECGCEQGEAYGHYVQGYIETGMSECWDIECANCKCHYTDCYPLPIPCHEGVPVNRVEGTVTITEGEIVGITEIVG